MISQDILGLYKRLFVLGLLSVCLVVFAFSSKTESVLAVAPCMQDCEASYAMCTDACAVLCDGLGDEQCTSCVDHCGSNLHSCSLHAIWCNEPTLSYTPRCVVDAGVHCPIISGQSDCQNPNTHWAYTLTCSTLGGNHCVACPDHPGFYCEGASGLLPCYP